MEVEVVMCMGCRVFFREKLGRNGHPSKLSMYVLYVGKRVCVRVRVYISAGVRARACICL